MPACDYAAYDVREIRATMNNPIIMQSLLNTAPKYFSNFPKAKLTPEQLASRLVGVTFYYRTLDTQEIVDIK